MWVMSSQATSVSDHELLADYAATHSSAAFNELVSRHIDLVYTAAARQVHNPHLAEDVTQAVFLILSQRARAISPKSVLPANSASSTNDHNATELPRRRRKITPLLGASAAGAAELGSAIGENSGASQRRLTTASYNSIW